MSRDWDWPGARWWKCDFHMHTPASYDFTDRDHVTATEWVAAVRTAGLDAVAITDHNTGAFVGEIKAAAATEGREMVTFPGVELTVPPGIHLLVLFPSDRDADSVTSFLGKCDIPDQDRGRPEALGRCTFEQALDWAHEREAICIAAHVDEAKGLLKELVTVSEEHEGKTVGCQTLQHALANEHLAAVEIKSEDQSLLAFVDGSKPEYQRPDGNLPFLSFSDAHSLAQIGSRFTWLKMTAPTSEGIRLALLDGAEHSIKYNAGAEQSPNAHGSNVIEAIEISNAKYLGRGTPFTMRFNPWLNSIIGGRGTGKSTIIELLRIVCDREAEIPKRLQDEFAKYRMPYESRSDIGLLHPQAKLSLFYRKDAARFRIDWSLADNARSIYEHRDVESWVEVQGEISQRFPVRIFSQKQIFELAREPLALLRVVDDAEDVDRLAWDEEWRGLRAAFFTHRAKERELQTGLSDEPRLKGELDDVRRRLGVFEAAGHADILMAYQKRLRQRRDVDVWERSWSDSAERLRKVSESMKADALQATTFNADDDADAGILQATVSIHEQFSAIREEIEKLAERADSMVQDWLTTRQGLRWSTVVEEALSAYEDLKKKLDEEDAGDPNEYGRLVEERQRLEERLRGFEHRRQEISVERTLGDESLSKMVEMRRYLTERRKKFLSDVLGTNQYVRIEVEPYNARDMVERDIRQLLGRETGGFEKDIGTAEEDNGLVADIYGSGVVEDGLLAVKTRIREIAAGKGVENVRDKRFATHLGTLPPENLDRLDCWFPEDSLKVQYSTTSDGGNFRPIREGSPGQKTAALLAFLLSYGVDPIVLDQPEDDLDNHLIYGLIVSQLKAIKCSRQVILVTHNANIVVNGDAEYVAALDARSGQTIVLTDGGLQQEEVRKTICRIMEGGEKAFEDRYRRIGRRGRADR